MIFEAADDILGFFNVTPDISYLGLQVLINEFHSFPLSSCAVSLPLFIMSGKLIFLNKFKQFDIITLKLHF
jgi:hypothetical protein